MNHELTPSHTDPEATIVSAVGSMRQLLRDETGRKLVDPQPIDCEDGTLMLGYEDASFEWDNPRLLIDIRVNGSTARGIFTVDCRSTGHDDTPVFTVTKFDQQLRSVRSADEAELDDIARLVSGVNHDYVDSVLERRRPDNQRSGISARIAAVFSRNR